MSPAEFARAFPQLYHMAWDGAWPSIKRYGLLSTSALLDLFEVPHLTRETIEASNRREAVEIRHAQHGVVTIRDQKPMSDAGLRRCLQDDLTPADWYRMLNQRVFFWPTLERLETLLSARAYRTQRHTLITIDTSGLLNRHADSIEVTTLNTGCTVPFPWPRGRSSFVRLAEFDFDESRRKRGRRRAIAEVAVVGGVPDIAEFVIRAECRGHGLPTEVLFERESR